MRHRQLLPGAMPARGVLLLLMATAKLPGRAARVGTAMGPQDHKAAGGRRLSEGRGELCIDVLGEQCSGLVEELGCDGLFAGNSSSVQALVRDVCYSSCTGCPCFNAYDDHSVDEDAQAPQVGSGAQLNSDSSEANGSAAGTGDAGQRSQCSSLIAQGTYSCASHFCTSCDFAGLCDLSCEFCKENAEPTPVCTNPYDDFQGPGACDSQIAGGHMTCAQDFCETCTYAGFCVLSCAGCGTNSVNTGGAAIVPVVSSSGGGETGPGTNSSAGLESELEAADSWCLWFGAALSNTKFCAHPLVWVAILPMTGALCGLILGCYLGCRAPPRMRKRMATEVIGVRDRDTEGDEIGGLEERPAGFSRQARGNAEFTAGAAKATQQDGLRRSDKHLRTSGRRASFASSASSSSVFTQSSSRVKHSRTRSWVQQNTANPVATDVEWSASDTGGRRRSGMVVRSEHAFDLETPPPSPPNELTDEEVEMEGSDSGGTPRPLQLTPEDFLVLIDDMTDDEVVQSCRELGLLTMVKNPRNNHQLRQVLRAHYAGEDSTPFAAATTSGPPPSLSHPQHQHHYHYQQHLHQHHHERQGYQHAPPHRLQLQPPTVQMPQLRGGSGSRRDPPSLLASEGETQGPRHEQGHGQAQEQGKGQTLSRPVRQTSQWIL